MLAPPPLSFSKQNLKLKARYYNNKIKKGVLQTLKKKKKDIHMTYSC